MRYECSKCGSKYSTDGMPPLSEPPHCSGSGSAWHTEKRMVERDEYQSALDDMGISEDDPLRKAT